MSDVTVFPARLSGDITVPPSKSAAHRAIFCAALGSGVSVLHNITLSDDILATIGAVQAIGCQVDRFGNQLTIHGISGKSSCPDNSPITIDCCESGSTLRFLIPILGAPGIPTVLSGKGRLPQRPIGCYLDCLPPRGLSLHTEGGLPLRLEGMLSAGEYVLPGNVSSQFITGLLLALPLLPGDSRIRLSSPLESAGYVDMTLAVLRDFGISVLAADNGWDNPGNQQYQSRDYTVEGD